MKSRLNKLINAFGNLPAIAEGIKNRVFTNDDVEDIAWKRWEICTKCELFDTMVNIVPSRYSSMN